jgi:hypothetical protein
MKTIKLFLLLLFLSLVQSCTDEFAPELGGNYVISHDGSYDRIILNKPNSIIIESEVVAFNFDSIFIIAKQKPYWSIMESIRKEYPKISYEKEKRLYKRSEIFNYWIIDKKEEFYHYYDEKFERNKNAVVGPLTYEEFWDKRRELNVSDTLRLKDLYYSDFLPVAVFQYLFLPRRMREVE